MFWGSSRTYHQINPEIIDSSLNKNNIRSFNLGSPGTNYPEGICIYDKFLDELPSNSNLKYTFVELTGLIPIGKVNMFTPRSFYYLDLKNLIFVVKYYLNKKDITLRNKINISYIYIQGFFLNHLLLFPFEQKADNKCIGEKSNGYYSLDSELKDLKSKGLLKRNLAFLKDTNAIIRNNKSFEKNTSFQQNTILVQYLKELILKSEKKNVKVYFIIPPSTDLRGTNFFKDSSYQSRIIAFNSRKNYPELYKAKNYFDEAHLNIKGADIYSRLLAEEISKRIKE